MFITKNVSCTTKLVMTPLQSCCVQCLLDLCEFYNLLTLVINYYTFNRSTTTYLIHPKKFFGMGMSYAGGTLKDRPTKTNYRRFRAHYGTSPGVCALLWNLIKPVVDPGVFFSHLLWGILFLKVYGSESVLASKVGVTEKSFREKVWTVVMAIASVKNSVVSKTSMLSFY